MSLDSAGAVFSSLNTSDHDAARAAAHGLHGQLLQWVVSSAYPLWARQGFDFERGGFYERLSTDGPVVGDARRARVQMRQVYCFANAPALGWPGDPVPLITRGLKDFFARYRRSDRLFCSLCTADGAPLDERALLYDQAFVLLALAESQKVLGPQSELLDEARTLIDSICALLKRPGPGFDSGIPERVPLLSNPHMHLLEAALAWREVSDDVRWQALANELVSLALDCLIDVRTGAIPERFSMDWLPLPGGDGRNFEPGHQFEWAWLLLRSGGGDARNAAMRLVKLGEAYGVVRGVAVNALLDDLSVHDAQARLWPQTERLKANARLAVTDARYWVPAIQAAETLISYLDAPAKGLWYDCMTANRRFIEEPAPASNFYHIIAAVRELGSAIKASAQLRLCCSFQAIPPEVQTDL